MKYNSHNSTNFSYSENPSEDGATSDISAVFLFMISLLFLGLVGNMITILAMCCCKRLHSPTYTAIGCLAIADFFTLLTMVALRLIVNDYQVELDCSECLRCFMNILGFASYFSSLGHILLLTSLRFVLTVHPLQSRHYFSSKIIVGCSLSCWVVSVCLATSSAFIFKEMEKHLPIKAQVFVTVTYALGMTIPLVVIGKLHCLKIKALSSSTLVPHSKHVQKMNRILAVILTVFVFYGVMLIINSIVFSLEQLTYFKGFLAWAVTSTLAISILIIKRYIIKTFCTCSCTHRRRNDNDTTVESRKHIPLSDTPNVTQPIPMDTPSQSALDASSYFSTPQSKLSPEISFTPSSTKPLLDAPAYNTRSKG